MTIKEDRTRITCSDLVIRCICCFTLVWTPVLSAQVPIVPSEQRANIEASLDRLQRLESQLEQLSSLIDTSQFDLEALLDALDYDASQIVDYVRDEIAFQAYRGLLRNPEGTVVSRAGNALEQSVLLAQLLNDAGFDARVAQGTLDADSVRTLIAAIRSPGLDHRSPFSDDRKAREVMRSINMLAGFAPDDGISGSPEPGGITGTDLWNQAIAMNEALFPSPSSPEPRAARNRLGQTLEEVAGEYFWVEWRDGPSDDWEPAHPAWPSSAEGMPVAKRVATLSGLVPDERLWKLALTVSIEQQKRDGARNVSVVMPRWERPIANLGTDVITLSSVPTNLGAVMDSFANDSVAEEILLGSAKPGPPQSLDEAVVTLVPTFNGSPPAGAMAFDSTGKVFPVDLAGNALAETFQQMNLVSERALAQLSDGSEEESVSRLDRIFVTIEMTGPGAPASQWERDIWSRDLVGMSRLDGLDARQNLAVALMSDVSIMAGATGPNSARVLLLQLEQQRTSLKRFMALLSAIADGSALDEDNRVDTVLKAFSDHDGDFASFEMLEIWAALSAVETGQSSFITYKQEPMILIRGQSLDVGAGKGYLRQWLDIVTNTRMTLTAEATRNDPAAAIPGIWDTLVERAVLAQAPELFEPFGWETIGKVSAADDFESASGRGLRPVAIGPDENQKLAELVGDNPSRSAMERDLAQGYRVVLFPDETGEASMQTWWRIDPMTGSALGVGLRGEGLGVVEYGTKLIGSIVKSKLTAALARFTITFLICVLGAFVGEGLKTAFENKPSDGRFMGSGQAKLPANPFPVLAECTASAFVGIYKFEVGIGAMVASWLKSAFTAIVDTETKHLVK